MIIIDGYKGVINGVSINIIWIYVEKKKFNEKYSLRLFYMNY